MDYVQNDVVQMQWAEEGWMETPTEEKDGVVQEGVFMFASQVYATKQLGEVTVFFTPDTAFLFISDVGRILRTFKIKKNVEVTDNGKIII